MAEKAAAALATAAHPLLRGPVRQRRPPSPPHQPRDHDVAIPH